MSDYHLHVQGLSPYRTNTPATFFSIYPKRLPEKAKNVYTISSHLCKITSDVPETSRAAAYLWQRVQLTVPLPVPRSNNAAAYRMVPPLQLPSKYGQNKLPRLNIEKEMALNSSFACLYRLSTELFQNNWWRCVKTNRSACTDEYISKCIMSVQCTNKARMFGQRSFLISSNSRLLETSRWPNLN